MSSLPLLDIDCRSTPISGTLSLHDALPIVNASVRNNMRDYHFFVYIMASKSRVLYVGMTNDLTVRVYQHKTGRYKGFTQRYRVHRLVYFESYRYVNSAIAREKELKSWRREKRIALIESINPFWDDLAAGWFTAEELARDPYAPVRIEFDPSKVRTLGRQEGLGVKKSELGE